MISYVSFRLHRRPGRWQPSAAALLRRFLVSAAMILLFFLRSRMISLPRRWTLSGDGPGCSSTSRCWPHRVSCSCPYPVAFRRRSFQDADRPWRQMPLDYDIMHNIMLIPSDIDFTTHFAVQFPKSFKILYWFILRTGTASQATPRGRRLYRAGVGLNQQSNDCQPDVLTNGPRHPSQIYHCYY